MSLCCHETAISFSSDIFKTAFNNNKGLFYILMCLGIIWGYSDLSSTVFEFNEYLTKQQFLEC